MTAAFYSVVRYVPSPIRDESMNVGVVVAMPSADYFDFAFHPRVTRLKCLSSDFNPDHLDAFEASLRERLGPWEQRVTDAWNGEAPVNGKNNARTVLDGEEEDAEVWAAADRAESILAQFAGEFAGHKIRLSPFRYVEMQAEVPMIEQGATLLSDLINDFVKPNRKKQKRSPYRTTPYQAFKSYLKSRNLFSKDPKSGVSSHFKYEMIEGGKLEFDFGVQGEVAHVFEAIDIEDPDITDPITRRAIGDPIVKFAAARGAGGGTKTYSVLFVSPEAEDQIRSSMFPLDSVSEIFNINDIEQAKRLESILKDIPTPSGDGSTLEPELL